MSGKDDGVSLGGQRERFFYFPMRVTWILMAVMMKERITILESKRRFLWSRVTACQRKDLSGCTRIKAGLGSLIRRQCYFSCGRVDHDVMQIVGLAYSVLCGSGREELGLLVVRTASCAIEIGRTIPFLVIIVL